MIPVAKVDFDPTGPLSVDASARLASGGVLVEGAVVAGRYRIERQIGVGGMGIVYRARDQQLDTDVALKVLRPSLVGAPQPIDRLRRELLLARAVTHRNVVRIHDIGESEGLHFLSMSLIEGRSLADVLRQDGPLPLARALRIVRQLAEALEQAHAAGIVHRDIKPGNILLAADDTAYLTDFGLARSLQRDEWTGTGLSGTLDYLSPEQARGDPLDARSDIYTLGIVLFEMLTGQLPFRADSPAETLALHIAARARDISDTSVRVPARIRAVIGRCLQRRPARRYANTRELIGDLDRRRAPPLPSPRAAVLALLALIGVGIAVATSRPWVARSAPAVRDAPVDVAVLPLANATGDASLAWAGNGIAEMLAADLAEAPRLRVIDSARVARTLRDVSLDARGQDPATMRRIADLLGVERLVVGSLRRAGTSLRVDLRLVSVHADGRGGAPVLAAETPDAGGLFGVVATLGDRLRQELGAARRPADPVPEPQTASLAAAEAYRQGRERLEMGDSVGAAPAFERAIAADGGYAAAHLALSEAYQALGYYDKALAAAERAAAALGAAADTRLAWRSRARLARLRGDHPEAERASTELARRYPNDTEALLDQAAAQLDQGAVATAVATLRQLTALDSSDPRAWFLLGKSMILVGDARQAVTDPLVRALALMTQLGNTQGRGDVLNAMGVAHQRLGEHDAATARYAEAAALRQQAGDQRGAAVSLTNRAGILVTLGRFAEAEPDLQAARDVYRRIGDRDGLASAWSGWGALHEGRGEYRDALGAYREALRIRHELGNQQQIGQSYDDVGYAYFLQGDHDNALVYWRQALELRQQVGDKRGVVLSTQSLGFLQLARGRWPEAMKSFLDALEKAREIELTDAIAVSHGNIALLHQLEGRYAAALSGLEEALAILRRLGDARGLAEFTIKRAAVLTELGRLEQAKLDLDAAAAWVSRTGNREQASDLDVALGEWELARGEPKRAHEACVRAVELARASGSQAAILRARIARGMALVAMGQADLAEPDLVQAEREAERLGEALLRLRALEARGRSQLDLGRLRAAEETARVAIQLAERWGWESGLPRLYALLGRARERRGDAAGASSAYDESSRRVARLRDALPPAERHLFHLAASEHERGRTAERPTAFVVK